MIKSLSFAWLLGVAALSNNLETYNKCLAQSTTLSPTNTIMDVSFPSSDGTLQLEGTLRLPCLGCTELPLSPGVVLIHGSGPHSRDAVLPLSYGFSIPIFEEIATSLVRDHGIAVLTYDKRTCGAFNNCNPSNQYPLPSPNMTMDDFIADAAAAIDFLQARPDVGDVVAVGHSQGGQLVPLLLQQDSKLAGGVMLAGPYHSIDAVLQDQFEFSYQTLIQQGLNETAATAALIPMKTMIEGVTAVKNGSTVDPVGSGASALFWQSWLEVTQRTLAAAAAIQQPLLLINGLHDTNVFPSEAEAWDTYLTKTGATYQLEMLPCITHALNCVDSPSLINATSDQIGRHVDDDVIISIANFVSTVAINPSSDESGGPSSPSTTPGPKGEDRTSNGGRLGTSSFLGLGVMALASIVG